MVQIKAFFLRPLPFIFLSLFFSILIMAAVFPDLLVHHNRSFMWQHDLEIPYENTFTLVSHFYQGGIQLWNRYDQMSFGFSHLAYGLFTLSNLIVSALYILLSPLWKSPGVAFHVIYSVGFFSVNALIRTIGGYLLLRELTKNHWVIFLSLLYMNTLLSSILYMGLLTVNLYSYLPLLLFFILRFYKKFQLNDFLGAFIVMTMAVMNSALLALGYFYQTVHYFIVAGVVCALIFQRDKMREKCASLKIKETFNSKLISKLLLVLLLCVLMMLPMIMYVKNLNDDIYIAGSGIGQTEGRLQDIGKPMDYFKTKGQSYVNQRDIIRKSLDHQHNTWVKSWVFLGASTLALIFLGLIFSKRWEKHIFLWTVLLIFFSNSQCELWSVASFAHWVNAFTNPFSFLLRSFHMTALLMPLYLFPLVALGLEAAGHLGSQKSENVYRGRLPLALCLVLVFFVLVALFLPQPAKTNAIFALLLLLIFLYVCWSFENSGRSTVFGLTFTNASVLLPILIISLLVFDLFGLSVYINNDSYCKHTLKSRIYKNLSTAEPLIAEYQNPKVLPVREFARVNIKHSEPLVYREQNHYGLYYRFTHFGRFFGEPDIYRPRHRAYAEFHTDKELKAYLQRNHKMIFFARGPSSVNPGEFSLISNTADNMSDVHIKEEFDFSHAKRSDKGEHVQYSFKLPKDFPKTLSTTVFTEDSRNWQMMIDNISLTPVQGLPAAPFTFDVRNAKSAGLTVLLTEDFDVRGKKAVLDVRSKRWMSNIWENTNDRFGFDYQAPNDGWLVFHFPFDKKWQLTVDGKETKFYNVNRYFIGIPIKEGNHRIHFSYWPGSIMRWLLTLSIIIMPLTFLGVVAYGLKRQEKSEIQTE